MAAAACGLSTDNVEFTKMVFDAKGKLETITPLSGQQTLLPPAGSANVTVERMVPAQKATEWAALVRTDHGQFRHRHCPDLA